MHPEVNVLALIKGQDRYVFVYDDESHEQTIDAIRDHAADPELNLSWFDASVLIRKAREQVRVRRLIPAAPPRP
jgi:hypothetical protein